VLSRWFGKKPEISPPASIQGPTGPRVLRHSGGWAALRRRLEADSGLQAIDMGYTSPSNINYLTSLGHSVFLADVVRDACTGNWQTGVDEDGNPDLERRGFLSQSLNFSGRTFDVVLLWTALDYLPEALVAPVVARLFEATNPDGQVLAFFHTRTRAKRRRTAASTSLPATMSKCSWPRSFPSSAPLPTAASSELFAAWSGYRQFLAKDSVSELHHYALTAGTAQSTT
jgi:hypothetical protein